MEDGINTLYFKVLMAVCVMALLLALLPWYSHHLQTEALRHAEMGEQVKSLHVAERAVSMNPLSIQARFVLAGAQQRVGRTVEARKTLVSAIDMQPLNHETWLQLALYERDRWGEAEKAREHFATAISLNPYDDHMQVEAGVKDVEDLER